MLRWVGQDTRGIHQPFWLCRTLVVVSPNRSRCCRWLIRFAADRWAAKTCSRLRRWWKVPWRHSLLGAASLYCTGHEQEAKSAGSPANEVIPAKEFPSAHVFKALIVSAHEFPSAHVLKASIVSAHAFLSAHVVQGMHCFGARVSLGARVSFACVQNVVHWQHFDRSSFDSPCSLRQYG